MNDPILTAQVTLWMRKKTYVWSLVGLGVIQGVVAVVGMSRPGVDTGTQLPLTFALNVATLGWCYADAKEKLVPISGLMRAAMLVVSLIGVPWYFLRTRGLVGAAKGGFGLGLFVLWLGTAMVAMFVGLIIKMLLFGGST